MRQCEPTMNEQKHFRIPDFFRIFITIQSNRKIMKIRPYSKSELAQAYAPEITSQAALNRLAAWIRLNRPLTEALRQTGYYTKQRLFTSRQVALIFEYLGEP